MHIIAIINLAIVVGQVASHPPPFTLDDNDGQIYTGIMDDNDGQIYTGIMNVGEGDIEIISVEKPFEWSNLKSVAAGELYQGDILLTEEQWAALRERKAVDNLSQRWTEGADGFPLVPYVFQDTTYKSDILAGIDHWKEHTCIKFEETTNTAQPHLQFYNGGDGVCNSYVGMIPPWNGQTVSIGTGCNGLGTVVHEVGHAMGFYHEQSRSDRDDYVVILVDNILTNSVSNFDKHNDNNYNVLYDYSSNMHYGIDYWTKNGYPTIITLDPLAQGLIGSRDGLSHRDKLLANRMYNCTGKWLDSCNLSSNPCLNDGYTDRTCVCVCPPGTSGTNCEVIDGDYYAAKRSALDEKITSETTITIVAHLTAGDRFTKWIVPPTCKRAKVTFTSSGNMYSGDCKFQYLYIRTDPADYNGEILCKADINSGVTKTSDTGIIISMINSVNYGGEGTFWSADVTFEDIAGCSGPPTTTQPPTTTPVNPTTTAPTNPPTTTPVNPTTTAPTTTANPLTTTEAPPSKLACVKNPRKKTMTKGAKFTITSPGYPKLYSSNKIKCGWKFKAKYPANLLITCDAFDLHGRDVLKVNRKYFQQDNIPPPMVAKWLGIRLFSKKRSSGPGFTCVVEAV